jgi:tetrahydromethanopterin S-methyltransferase subunit G
MNRLTTTVLPVAVGITNVTQLIEPTMEEDSGLVAGIVIGVVTFVLVLAALVSPIRLYHAGK